MDFSLTDEQTMVRDTARSLLGAECPSSLVRAHAEDPSVADDLWARHLAGWATLGEGDLVDLALFAQEGAALLPGVWFPTAAMALPLLAAAVAATPDDELEALAAQLGSGAASATLAAAGPDGVWSAEALAAGPLRAWVPEADRVDTVVVVGAGPEPGTAWIRALAPADLPAPPRLVETLDTSRRLFELELPDDLDGVTVPVAAVGDAMERIRVAAAAELVGVARWLLDTAVTYAGERVQFDRPIGSFQGLQFALVDMALDVERAEAAVYAAAMLVDAGDPDRARAAHVAKAAAGTAARHCAKGGMQVLGGIGYTWEHDLHLYLRRAYAGDALFGGITWHHDQLAAHLF